jgi:N-methylhydantoinase B/oxoprolinase/acetone carboxylase alpha subunit
MALNHMVKKSAVKKYSETPKDQLRAAISADEKGYSAEEIDEIITALGGDVWVEESGAVTEEQFNKLQPSVTGITTKHKWYEEWKVEIKQGGKVVDKLKMTRPCVKISEEQAEILNEGRRYGGNTITEMYFKP